MSQLPPQRPTTVSVIICAYTERRYADIRHAVEALRTQTRDPDEVIVVVDHNETLRSRLTNDLRDSVTVIENRHGLGLSGARNTGVAAARGDVLLFLDDDAHPEPQWIRRMLAPFTDPAVQVVGGAAVPVWPTARPGWLPPELDWVVGCSYVGLPTRIASVRNPIGAAMALRRAVFEVVGGFVEGVGRVGSLPLGCEETELCIRLRQARPDAMILYEPEAVVHHRVTDDRVRWRYLWRRCYAEGLSKAAVAALVGRGDALVAERTYLRHTLPAALRRDLAGGAFPRAVALLTGVACTGAGYLRRSVRFRVPGRQRSGTESAPASSAGGHNRGRP